MPQYTFVSNHGRCFQTPPPIDECGLDGRPDPRQPDSGLAQLAQKHQEGEGKLQPPPVSEDITRESEVAPEPEGEQGQREDGSDAPGSQNTPAAAWLPRRALRLGDGVLHRSASCHLGSAGRSWRAPEAGQDRPAISYSVTGAVEGGTVRTRA